MKTPDRIALNNNESFRFLLLSKDVNQVLNRKNKKDHHFKCFPFIYQTV